MQLIILSNLRNCPLPFYCSINFRSAQNRKQSRNIDQKDLFLVTDHHKTPAPSLISHQLLCGYYFDFTDIFEFKAYVSHGRAPRESIPALPQPHPRAIVYTVLFRIPVRECARTLWMGAPFWGRGGRIPKAGTRSVSRAQIREERRRDRMRRWQEVKEDDPFMASGCQHAQSE